MEWEQLDRLIREYRKLLRPLVPLFFRGTDWDSIRDMEAEIHGGFKGVRYPTPKQQEEAWARFSDLRSEASTRRDGARSARPLRN